MQVSHRLDTEVSQEKVVQGTAARVGSSAARVGPAKRMRNRGRSSIARSCPYPDFNPAEICRGPSCGLHQRQECHPHRPNLWWPETKLHGPTFLGTGLLCFDRWPG